jgi:hypothetical protein
MQTPKIKNPITWSYTCNKMQTPKIKKPHHLILHMQQDANTQD